jgi:hypothetical protein
MSGPSYQVSLFDEGGLGYHVRSIEPKDAHFFILNVHYARRIPSISYAFGLLGRPHPPPCYAESRGKSGRIKLSSSIGYV